MGSILVPGRKAKRKFELTTWEHHEDAQQTERASPEIPPGRCILVVRIAVMAALLSMQVSPAADKKQTLEISFSPDTLEVASNDNLVLYARVCNLSTQPVDLMAAISNDNLNVFYDYSIHDSSGRAVPRVHPTTSDSLGIHPGGLGPGQCVNTGIQGLMTAYTMRQPGVYKVQVSRYDSGHLHWLGSSNIVTVTVRAPK